MNLRQAAEQALECLDYHWDNPDSELEEWPYVLEAKRALRQALAQSEQEPVAWISAGGMRELLEFGKTEVFRIQDYETTGTTPLYTAPPKKEWVGLSDEELEDLEFASVDKEYGHLDVRELSRAIEAKLKEKNG